jgi:uncharacterized membrane-anchored protein
MIAEREVVEKKPVEKPPAAVEERPALALSQPQPEWSEKLFIASNICLLVGLLFMAIALILSTSIALNLALLITEVSLFVVGAILFALGYVWPRIK